MLAARGDHWYESMDETIEFWKKLRGFELITILLILSW